MAPGPATVMQAAILDREVVYLQSKDFANRICCMSGGGNQPKEVYFKNKAIFQVDGYSCAWELF